MIVARKFVFCLALATLVWSVGCDKHKKIVAPEQAQAPTIPISLPDEVSPSSTPPPPKPTPLPPVKEATVQPPPKPKKRGGTKKPASPVATAPVEAAAAASGAPAGQPASTPPASSTVAANHPPHNEGELAIATAIPNEEISRRKRDTEKLLEATQSTLSKLPQNLSGDQSTIVEQIKSYISQSQKATSDGDFERAFNLANKAHQLSDALVSK
jgi:hypothetical protein